jgi:hypothetical protein
MMKTTNLLRYLGAGACLVLASCETVYEEDTIRQRNSGYSLDDPPSGQSRYLGPQQSTTTTSTTTTVETSDPGAMVTTPDTVSSSTPPAPAPEPSADTLPAPSVPAPPVPPAPTGAVDNSSPTYGKMVPGRPGFVYPPGVDSKPENMVDVRDFTPGQKVRDPRTGKIFLVP